MGLADSLLLPEIPLLCELAVASPLLPKAVAKPLQKELSCPAPLLLCQSANSSSKMKAIFCYYSLFGLFLSPSKLIFKREMNEVSLDIDC